MAPTVYISDVSCDPSSDSDNNASDSEERPTIILGYGVNDLRVRKCNHMIHRREMFQERRPLMGLTAEASRHPTSPDQDERITTSSIESNVYHQASISLNGLQLNKAYGTNLKSWNRSSHCHRLLLLRKREGLLDITVRTVALIRRNQQLQIRLAALQAETRAFVKSVMNNPENQGVKLQTPRNMVLNKKGDFKEDISMEMADPVGTDSDSEVDK